MSVLSAEQVTNLYLYGSESVPANLTSDARIRSAEHSVKEVDVNAFMGGPGRFANVGQFELLKRFFDSSYSLPPGTYSEIELRAALGLGKDAAFITVEQVYYDDGLDDYAERAYIWNTGAFEIEDNAKFVVGAGELCSMVFG